MASKLRYFQIREQNLLVYKTFREGDLSVDLTSIRPGRLVVLVGSPFKHNSAVYQDLWFKIMYQDTIGYCYGFKTLLSARCLIEIDPETGALVDA